MNSTNSFKVIIVGGGPVGLVAAHAFTQAGIDFTMLESRPDIVLDAGSNLVLLPTGMRVLSQLGLLKALNAVSSPLAEASRIDHEGNNIGPFNVFVHLKDNHGTSPRVISRHDLTKVLYDALPAHRQATLLPNKRVCAVSTNSSGVVVTCRDGTSYSGSMVLGADGAHSFIRDQMRRLALQSSPIEAVNDEKPFETTYNAMWIRFPTMSGLQPGDASETHGSDAAIQLFAGEETTVIGVYARMEKPTKERVRWTQADEEAFVEKWGHLPLSHGLTIREAYNERVGAGLVSLEEGVVSHWSWDRIVLAGDAAHKFTPSTAAGCNNGILDVVVLANELHKAVQAVDGLPPSKEQLGAAFKAYQERRYATVMSGLNGARRATDAATWHGRMNRFVDLNIMSSARLQKAFLRMGAVAIARSPVLDFVEVEEEMVGKVPWVQQIQPAVVVVS